MGASLAESAPQRPGLIRHGGKQLGVVSKEAMKVGTLRLQRLLPGRRALCQQSRDVESRLASRSQSCSTNYAPNVSEKLTLTACTLILCNRNTALT